MKFEHLLKVYWRKGFFFNTKLISFDLSWDNFRLYYGIGSFMFKLIAKRFELFHFFYNYQFVLKKKIFKIRKAINFFFAKLTSINVAIQDLLKYNLLKLYYIKSYKGRCLFLGKPANGQRSWSNGWNAYYLKNYFHSVLNSLNLLDLDKDKKDLKFSYTTVVKKDKHKKKFFKIKIKTKKQKLQSIRSWL